MCAHLRFEIMPQYTGEFSVTIRAKDSGGREQDGIDEIFKSFVIKIALINDAPEFALLLHNIHVLQTRPPSDILVCIVYAQTHVHTNAVYMYTCVACENRTLRSLYLHHVAWLTPNLLPVSINQ